MSWNRATFAPIVLVILGVTLIATSQLVDLPWAGAQAGTTHYVDCSGGSDSRNGTSQANAWKTLAPVKNAKLAPGDSLLFKRGCTWQGPFQAKWTGTAGSPIRIGAYGNGAAPKFAHGNTTNVMITGAYQVIEDLQTEHVARDYDIASDGQPMGWKIGFNFQNGAHHNTVQRIRTNGHAAGVNFAANTHKNRVLDSFIGNNFGMWSNTTAATGVLLHGDANEIAHNTFENNRALKRPERSVSLEIFNNTRGNIHHNVSYDRKFAELGSGNTTTADNVIAHNVHWSNFEPKGDAKGSLFVVTRGQGCNFGPVRNTIVQNNTVYLSGTNSEAVVAGCTKDGNVITLKNNIIVARHKGYFLGGGGGAESHNTYWPVAGLPAPNNFLQGQEMHATSQIADPQFVEAANRDLRLKSGSPASNHGASASAGGGSGGSHGGGESDSDSGGESDSDSGGSGGDRVVEPEIPASFAVPGRIQAEDYRQGGPGVGYHDTTAGNTGGEYRNDDVDIQSTQDTGGGYNVGWIDAGEWLAYNIEVPASGQYVFTFRTATIHNGQSLHVQLNGSNVTGSVSVPNTGGWQSFTDVSSQPVTIAAGSYTLTLVAESKAFNINYVDVAVVEPEIPASFAVPGRIQAEDYRQGGPGVGYHDTTAGNAGGEYRNDDVDIQATQDAGGEYNVGWIDVGEWLAYNIEVPASGHYVFTFRVATIRNGQSLHVLLDDVNVSGSVSVPNTGGWQAFTDVSSQPLEIAAGSYTLKVVSESKAFNINYIDVEQASDVKQASDVEQASQAATPGVATTGVQDQTAIETDAALTASFAVACDELDCRFDASGSTGAIETYIWDFGDGTRESGAVVSHLYTEGTYAPTLTVTDASGQSSTSSQEVVVAATAETPAETKTVVTFAYSCDALARTCAFDATRSEGDISAYAWDFGDGSPTASGETASHAYSAGGSYTVTLTVTDARGAHSDSQTVALPFSMHVADLEGSVVVDGQSWTAEIMVTVHDEEDNPLPGVTVAGNWSNSGSTEFTCETDEDGQCTLDGRFSGQLSSAVFTVTDLRHAAHVYDESANSVPDDGDTDAEHDGASITVSQEQ